jgi:hypothetical protein
MTKGRRLLSALGLSLALAGSAAAEDPPPWDQAAAEARVRACVALEASGQPWDAIRWVTDVDVAVARARRLEKPIFVFFYVVNQGPKEAPC